MMKTVGGRRKRDSRILVRKANWLWIQYITTPPHTSGKYSLANPNKGITLCLRCLNTGTGIVHWLPLIQCFDQFVAT